MLTADLVIVRKSKGELFLPELRGKPGDAVRHWSIQVLEAARECVGAPREQYSSLVSVMGETSQERKLARGLAKLVEDGCTFEQACSDASATIRSEIFLRSTQVRRVATADNPWDRSSIVREICANSGIDVTTFEERMYADLPGAQQLLSVPEWSPEVLTDLYDTSRLQAVLLRSLEVRVTYAKISPRELRVLFRQLKFRRLLHRSEGLGDGGLKLTIDGPYSLLDAVTKYGLQMALIVPALRAAGDFELSADLQWGHGRERTKFHCSHHARTDKVGDREQAESPNSGPEELERLTADLSQLLSKFKVEPASALIDLPGVGLSLPDLTFTDRDNPSCRIHLELLGYWSRSSVWKRVEMVEAGLPEPVIFGVNQRLRVSEEVLEANASGALYVFRGQPNAKTLLQRVEQLASQVESPTHKGPRKSSKKAVGSKRKRVKPKP